MSAVLHALPLRPERPELLDRPDIWRGRRRAAAVPSVSTGHAALDALLPSNGWPAGTLSEILHAADGVGELALVLPALAAFGDPRPIVWVAPPYVLNAPALRQGGVSMANTRVVLTDDALAPWAAEQCLRAGCCAAVLLWTRTANTTTLRRLQLAAEAGRCHGFVFRDERHAQNASPAPIRLSVRRVDGQPMLRIRKCRGLLAPPAHEVAFA
jgi:hypothetical protein